MASFNVLPSACFLYITSNHLITSHTSDIIFINIFSIKIIMIVIEKLIESPRKNKRYRVILSDDSHFDFGLEGATTFIDGASDLTKQNYWKRHLGNKTEANSINNYIPSPALFSAYLLWGDSRDIHKNVKQLNKSLIRIV